MPYTQKIHRNIRMFKEKVSHMNYNVLFRRRTKWSNKNGTKSKWDRKSQEIQQQTGEEELKKNKRKWQYIGPSEKQLIYEYQIVCLCMGMCECVRKQIYANFFPLIFSHSKFYLDVISVLLASRHEHISCYWWRSLLRAFANRSNWINTHTYGGIHITWYTIPRCTHTHTHTHTRTRLLKYPTNIWGNLFRCANLEFCHAIR